MSIKIDGQIDFGEIIYLKLQLKISKASISQ